MTVSENTHQRAAAIDRRTNRPGRGAPTRASMSAWKQLRSVVERFDETWSKNLTARPSKVLSTWIFALRLHFIAAVNQHRSSLDVQQIARLVAGATELRAQRLPSSSTDYQTE